MERRQIEYFVAVVEHGGFRKAASELYVTQPALSQAITLLEREFGSPLFRRTARGVILTPTGEAAIEPARQALRSLNAIQSAVSDIRGLQGGTLKIASLPTLAQWPLSPLIARFRALHPKVRVLVQGPDMARVSEVAQMVRDGRSDIGFTENAPSHGGLDVFPLGQEQFVAILPPGTSLRGPGTVSIDDVLECGLVVGPWWESSMPHQFLRQHVGRRVDDAIAVRIHHREAYPALVVAGAGAAIVPQYTAQFAADCGAVVARLEPELSRSIVMVTPQAVLPAAPSVFADLARDIVWPESAGEADQPLPQASSPE